MRRLLTDEQRDFFLQHQAGKRLQELADLMNDTFGLELTATQMRDQRVTLGVKGGRLPYRRSPKRMLTPEQEAFFVEHQAGLLLQEAAELMNKTFGLSMTVKHVKQQRRTLHVTGGKAYKGDKIKPNKGMFRKGSRPYNYLPVGTELVKDDGYLWRKIGEPNKWKQVHLMLWEEAHGPREKGHKIIFLNGDRMDIRLDNLAEVTNAVNSYLTTMHLRYQEAELTRAGINVARLLSACKNKNRRGKDGKEAI